MINWVEFDVTYKVSFKMSYAHEGTNSLPNRVKKKNIRPQIGS